MGVSEQLMQAIIIDQILDYCGKSTKQALPYYVSESWF